MKKKIMMIIGFTLLMSQFVYADANMDRLLNEARKRQAEEKLSMATADKDYTAALSELSKALSQLKAIELTQKVRLK